MTLMMKGYSAISAYYGSVKGGKRVYFVDIAGGIVKTFGTKKKSVLGISVRTKPNMVAKLGMGFGG